MRYKGVLRCARLYLVLLGCSFGCIGNLNVERIRGRLVEVVGAITTPPTFKTHLVGISGLDRNPPGVYQVFLRPDVLNHISFLKDRYIEYIHYILTGQDDGDDENVKN